MTDSTVYQTEDGQQHKDRAKAIEHSVELDLQRESPKVVDLGRYKKERSNDRTV